MTGQGQEPRRPVVSVDPAVRFGYPQVRGVPTDAAAGMVWAGEDVATVADEFNLTRAEVLVACWYETRHERPRNGYRAAWQRQWLEQAEWAMWHGNWDDVPDPPSKQDPDTEE